jgi:antitoxin component YwqK of YwqJK toxin-antitoxin module
MKKLFYIIILILFTCITHAQEATLINYILHPCERDEMSNLNLIQERIIEKTYRHDTLSITVVNIMNCCSGDKGIIEVLDDSLFLFSLFPDSVPVINRNGDTTGWDEPPLCDCECCFTLEYEIAGIEQKDYIVFINGKEIELRLNKYKEPGYFIYEGDTMYYSDSEGYSYQYSFYESGKLKIIRKQKYPNHIWTTFYENGQVKEKTNFYKSFFDRTIEYFTEKGIHHNTKIFSDTGYQIIEYYDNGEIFETGQYLEVEYPGPDTIIYDSVLFNIYETKICGSKYCDIRTGIWCTYYENGVLESKGSYLPREFTTLMPMVKDSSNTWEVIDNTSFDRMGMFAVLSTYLKDGIWECYNENGELIRKEYYSGGLLREIYNY